jgi:hypothetical protein
MPYLHLNPEQACVQEKHKLTSSLHNPFWHDAVLLWFWFLAFLPWFAGPNELTVLSVCMLPWLATGIRQFYWEFSCSVVPETGRIQVLIIIFCL